MMEANEFESHIRTLSKESLVVALMDILYVDTIDFEESAYAVRDQLADSKPLNWTAASDDPRFDWTGYHGDKRIDLVRAIDNTWSAYYDNGVAFRNMASREDARQALEEWVSIHR